MRQRFYRFFAMLMIPFMVAFNCPIVVVGADVGIPVINIEITHYPVEKATAGQRIVLEAEIEDESGIEVVRAYFKAVETENYNFVELEAVTDQVYKGALPAPANGAGKIEYLILVKNGNNQVVKTQTYSVFVEDDDNTVQAIANNDLIKVYTELKQVPTELSGFSDNMVIDVVESAARLGVVAGLYSSAAGSSTSGSVSAGTVAASTGGFSTTTIVVSSIAALAVVGGVAAASGGGSGGGGAPENGGATCPYQGSWRGVYTEISCDGLGYSDNWTGTVDAGCFFFGFASTGGNLSGTINSSTGSAQLAGVDSDCGAINGSAVFSGNSVSGSYGGSGVSGSFSGSR